MARLTLSATTLGNMMLHKSKWTIPQTLSRQSSRLQHHYRHKQQHGFTTMSMQQIAIWKKNFARLYARHVMELAIAASFMASTKQQVKAKMAEILKGHHHDKPLAWLDWKQADWEQTALDSVGTTKFQRFIMSASRLVQLTILASPLAILLPLSSVSNTIHDYAWEYALYGIEQAGPLWIKLFQWMTTRQDLFDAQFCQYFGKLRDDTKGHSWKETQQILQKEFGSNIVSNLQLDPTPIGSGCIAQVYKGKLQSPVGLYPAGTEVAVKVQHPNIFSKVCIDFYILRKVADFLEGLPYLQLQYLSLSDTIRQFRDLMLPQMDLQLEMMHLQRFDKDFQNDNHVSFPKPIPEYTTSQVLTETFLYGRPILDFVDAPSHVRQSLAKLGLQTTLKMIFLHDFVHGDMHPGNILVGGEYPNLQLQLLDCGLVLEMGPDQHVNLVKVLGALTRRNGRLAGQLMVDLKAESQASPLDVELFVQGIEQICIIDQDQNFIEKIGEYITDICTLACQHKVKLEAAFINAALAVEIMEGIAGALYPTLTVQSVALPLVVKAEMMHRLGLHHH